MLANRSIFNIVTEVVFNSIFVYLPIKFNQKQSLLHRFSESIGSVSFGCFATAHYSILFYYMSSLMLAASPATD
jgi:hypothetical protein